MSQIEERNKAIERVRKLRNRVACNGSSESEVETAMKLMGQLMDTFDITMDEVSLAAEECKMVELEYADGGTFRLGTVVVAVANFCDCVTYYNKKSNGYKTDAEGKIKRCGTTGRPLKKKPTYVNNFYGISSDAETAAYLMEMIREAAKTMLTDFKKSEVYKNYQGSKLSLTKSFIDGFAGRMVTRLNRLKREREEELAKAREARAEDGEDQSTLDAEVAAHERRAGRSTDLIALKDKKVKDDFKARYGWSVKYRTGFSGTRSYTGRVAGAGAADKVNLTRPLGNGGGYSGQLKLGHG